MRLVFIFLLSLSFFHSVQSEPPQSIGIFTYKVYGMEPWDPDSIKSGINGSEEAVIYMSQKLAQLGYKVLVFGHPPTNSSHSLPEANPRFVDVDFKDDALLDVAISWRQPDAAANLKKRARYVYLWPHDTYESSLTEAQINGFQDVLWVSEWQRKYWISANPGFAKFTKIFGNGINPTQFQPIQERSNPYSCIYSSNYARGLDILLDHWPTIKQQFPQARLDIYYGWRHWGILPPQKEAKMRAQVAQLASLDVYDHGQVGHEELNRAYEKASFWTYPCTGWEVFCITALRAQMAGAFPVIIEGTALTETVRHGVRCSKPEDYCATLLKAMQNADKITLEERKRMREWILQEYTWDVVARKWKELFDTSLVLEGSS
jgi:glycosyltransferase involved in cell wall biosynthesis